jgi:hypothetical protein
MKCTYKKRKVSYTFTWLNYQAADIDESFQSAASKNSKANEEDSDAIDSEREDPGPEQKSRVK